MSIEQLETQVESSQKETGIHQQVIDSLRSIGWQRFIILVDSIGSELNDRQWRFLKSTVLELGVASYSGGILSHVGATENGCDFIIPSLDNTKIEMKYQTDVLYPAKGIIMRDFTKEIKLMNSMGTNTHTDLPEGYADYLLIVDKRGAAVIHKDSLKQFLKINGDSISARIPSNMLIPIFTPSDISPFEKKRLDIKARVLSVILEAIEDI